VRRTALVALAGCRALAAPVAPSAISHQAGAGIAIALYAGADGATLGVVDDRRWVDIRDGELELDHIDPGATLATLVIEPLGGAPVHLRACTRDRLPDLTSTLDENGKPTERFVPVVRCAVDAAQGRHLVRVMYVSSTLAYRGQHEVTMIAPDRATVASRFAVQTPAWAERAEVVLYDGIPGGEHPAREVMRGAIALDGSVAILAARPRDLPAQLRRVFDGALISGDTAPTDSAWAHDASQAVGVWLELPELTLAPGPVHVHLELAAEGTRELDVPAASRAQETGTLRLPLWIDDALHGLRQRSPDFTDGASLGERFVQSVANLGEVPREVWIEEPLRPARKRRIERAWPSRPVVAGDRVRTRVRLEPGRIERVGYTIAYEF
jgi:hypothetical protein